MIPANGTYRELQQRWLSLDGGAVRMREITCEGNGTALLCVDIGKRSRPAIALSAGIHGDEPAGAWALLELVEARKLDARFTYRIWPCTNPSGFDARTRASADGVDLNRTFSNRGSSPEARAILAENRGRRFELSLDLHEDCDAAGFYCYEYGGDLGGRVLAAIEARGYPIDPLEGTFELAGPLDDAHCTRERGRVAVPDANREAVLLGGASYSIAMARHHARAALTFETPLSAAWELRRAMHRTAVLAAIGALLEESA